MEIDEIGLMDIVAIVNKELNTSYNEDEIKIIFENEINQVTKLIERLDNELIKFELKTFKKAHPYFIVGVLIGLNLHTKKMIRDRIDSISIV